MRPFFAAIRFLTVLPVPARWAGDEHSLARSVPCFPLVGLLIGLIAAGFDYCVGLVLPIFPASVLTVFLLICLTGGLHMDGLADTADGFFSARPRDQMMAIMRDSRIGVMGVLAVLGVLSLKIALLAALADSSRCFWVLLAPLAGRTAVVTLMSVLPYARKEGGLVTLFAGRQPWLSCLWAWALAFGLSAVFARGIGLVGVLLALVATALLSIYSRSKIGGYTGDTLGASCEVVEIVPLLTAVISYHRFA